MAPIIIMRPGHYCHLKVNWDDASPAAPCTAPCTAPPGCTAAPDAPPKPAQAVYVPCIALPPASPGPMPLHFGRPHASITRTLTSPSTRTQPRWTWQWRAWWGWSSTWWWWWWPWSAPSPPPLSQRDWQARIDQARMGGCAWGEWRPHDWYLVRRPVLCPYLTSPLG